MFSKKSLNILKYNAWLVSISFLVCSTIIGIIISTNTDIFNSAKNKGLVNLVKNFSATLIDNEFVSTPNVFEFKEDTISLGHIILIDKTTIFSPNFNNTRVSKDIETNLIHDGVLYEEIPNNPSEKIFLYLIWKLCNQRKNDIFSFICYFHHNSSLQSFLNRKGKITESSLWTKNINYKSLINEISNLKVTRDTKTSFIKIVSDIEKSASALSLPSNLDLTMVSDFHDDSGNNISLIESKLADLALRYDFSSVNIISFELQKNSLRRDSLLGYFSKYFGANLNIIRILDTEVGWFDELSASTIIPPLSVENLFFIYPYRIRSNYPNPSSTICFSRMLDDNYTFSFFSKNEFQTHPVLKIKGIEGNIALRLNQASDEQTLKIRKDEIVKLTIDKLSERDFIQELFLDILSVKNGKKTRYKLSFRPKANEKLAVSVIIMMAILIFTLIYFVAIFIIYAIVHHIELDKLVVNSIFYIISFCFAVLYFNIFRVLEPLWEYNMIILIFFLVTLMVLCFVSIRLFNLRTSNEQ